MENVAYDVFDKFPELPPNIHWGEVIITISIAYNLLFYYVL